MYRTFKQTFKKMPALKFYNDMLSQPVRAVWILMKTSQIPFESVPVALLKGEHKKKDYLDKVPAGQVPAIEDEGFILTESQAILTYLCKKYPKLVASNWYPSGLNERARVDEYMSWHQSNLRKNGVAYFVNKFFLPNIFKKPVDDAKIQEVTENLTKTLDFLENNFLQKNPFLAGSEISLADLMAYCEIMQPVAEGFDVKKGRPKLAAWMEKVKGKLSPVVTEAHEAILELCKSKK